ncbi:MAG: recombinase family protein [Pyrobaculum sp.]
MIPVVTYIRVSTEEQDPENQRAYLERWAMERGLRILKHYVEHGISGAVPPWERPIFRQLVEEVPKLGAKALLVYELSRLVRSFNELFSLMELVEGKMGMVVISASEREAALQNIDGIYRQFLRAVLAFVATMEREFIRQRTKTALERARREGRVWNVAERHPELVATVTEMYNSGASLGEVARALGLSTYEVRRLLAAAGLYRPSDSTCPRCFSKMKVMERTAKIDGGRYVVVERLYCKNCGYEEKRS